MQGPDEIQPGISREIPLHTYSTLSTAAAHELRGSTNGLTVPNSKSTGYGGTPRRSHAPCYSGTRTLHTRPTRTLGALRGLG